MNSEKKESFWTHTLLSVQKNLLNIIWSILDLPTCFSSNEWWPGRGSPLALRSPLFWHFLIFSCTPLLAVPWVLLPVPAVSFPLHVSYTDDECSASLPSFLWMPTHACAHTGVHPRPRACLSASNAICPETVSLVSVTFPHDFTSRVLKFYEEKELDYLPKCLTLFFIYFFYSLAELWMSL